MAAEVSNLFFFLWRKACAGINDRVARYPDVSGNGLLSGIEPRYILYEQIHFIV